MQEKMLEEMQDGWTSGQVIIRLEEAADTVYRLPPVGPRGHMNSWPAMIREAYELYWENDTMPKLAPAMPLKVTEMEEAMEWLKWLDVRETKIVWLRARGVRWKVITQRFKINRSTAWRVYSDAIERIVKRLNY